MLGSHRARQRRIPPAHQYLNVPLWQLGVHGVFGAHVIPHAILVREQDLDNVICLASVLVSLHKQSLALYLPVQLYPQQHGKIGVLGHHAVQHVDLVKWSEHEDAAYQIHNQVNVLGHLPRVNPVSCNHVLSG